MRQHPLHRPPSALLAAALLLAGCDVRDEEARRGTGVPWLTPAVARMAGPSQRAVPATAGGGRGLDCADGYAAGSRRAADAGLPMLLVFRATWCRWSQGLVAETLADPRLAAMAGRVVAVNVDADRDAAACRSFGVRVFPTVIVLDRDRRETFRASGAAARAGLALAVESALAAEPRRVAGQPADAPR